MAKAKTVRLTKAAKREMDEQLDETKYFIVIVVDDPAAQAAAERHIEKDRRNRVVKSFDKFLEDY